VRRVVSYAACQQVVLGVPGPAIRAMPLWRGDWGTSKEGLAEAVAPRGSTALRGVALGGATMRLAVGPGLVSYRATIEQPDGSFRLVDLGRAAILGGLRGDGLHARDVGRALRLQRGDLLCKRHLSGPPCPE
jgi:hypothetical protein